MNRTTILIEDALTKLYIDLSELVYAQADRNYTDIYLSNGRTKSYLIPISKVMEKIESVSLFAASSIKRIGRSHIINLNYVERIDFKRKEIHLKDINVTKLSCGREALKTLDDALKKKKAVNVLKQVRVQHSIKVESYDELAKEILTVDGVMCVDLGLPSGRLWAIENLDSPLDSMPRMFAWGETESKQVSTNDNYCFGKETALTKYTRHDGLTELLPEDDPATCILGEKWRTPAYKDFQELMDCCKWSWCTWGIYHGCLVTGPNDNSIFLHAGGYTSDSMNIEAESKGNYWTSTLYEDDEALSYRCSFSEGFVEGEDVFFFDEVAERFFAYYIRPVTN